MTHPLQPALPWWRDRLLIGVAVIFSGWSLLSLTWPLSGDAGVFAWMADTVYRGDIPYANAWDTKGPAAWLPSLLVQSVFGRTSWGIRLFDIAMVVVALASMRSIARRFEQPGAGRVAIALYATWYAGLDFWQSAQPDGWVAAWLILACATVMTGTAVGLVAGGALVGACTLVKPFYLGYAVVLFILIASMHTRTAGLRLRDASLVLVGLVAAIGAQLLFLEWRGGLQGFLDVQRWNRDVYAGLGDPWLTRIPASFKGMLMMPWGIVAPIALFGASRPTRAHRIAILALAVGFLGAVAGVMLQGKGWQYHWLPMLPFLALLADIGFAALRRENAGEIAGRFRWMALVLALVVAGLTPLQQLYRWSRSRVSADTVAAYERREFRYYGRHPGSVHRVVDSLSALTPAGRPAPAILVWAMHPAPQFMAGARIPTRFAVIRPLFDGPGSAYRASYRAEFLDELRRSPPRWWLQPTSALKAREEELRGHDIELFPEAADELHSNYRLATQTPEWLVYERYTVATPP